MWRVWLLAFRADFRRRHGAELLEAIDAERREPRYRGATGGVRHAVHVTVDLLASAIRERRAPKPEWGRRSLGTSVP